MATNDRQVKYRQGHGLLLKTRNDRIWNSDYRDIHAPPPGPPLRGPSDKHKMSLDRRKNLLVLDQGHGSYNFRQTNFKDFSRIFPGQIITVFKDYDSFNKSALFNSFLNTLLAKTRHGVIYDFYFFSHGWSHYIILLSATTLWKMTGCDLQLHLRYRNSI